ncbi:MAG: GNAT family N-acetyltransferase [Bacteroidota bacterium]
MIKTNRLALIPFSEMAFQSIFNNDLAELAKILNIEQPAHWTNDKDTETHLPEVYQAFIDSGGDMLWGKFFYVSAPQRQLIGTGGFKGVPDEKGFVEIAYEILPEFKNIGFATEAADALIDHAFSHNASGVRAHTTPTEDASIYVLRKLGMQYVENILNMDVGEMWRWEKYRQEA